MPNIKRCLDTMERASAVVRQLRSSGMVSGLSTFTGNILGTNLNVTSKPIRSTFAVPLDYIASKITGIRTRTAGEPVAEIYGMVKGIPSALKSVARRARAQREIDEITGNQLASRAMAGSGVAGTPGETTLATAPAIGGTAGKIVRTPFKALSVPDNWHYDRTFHGEMWKQAERQAALTGKTTKSVMDEQAKLWEQINKVESQADDIRKKLMVGAKPTREEAAALRRLDTAADELHAKSFVRKAAFMAERTVFTAREGESLDEILNGVDKMARHSILVDGVLPFRRTVANVVREALRGSPVGLAWAGMRAAKLKAAGATVEEIQGRLVDDMSQALVGTAVMYTFLHYASNGMLEANPYKEAAPAERATEEAAGSLPNTLRVGDWTVPVSKLEPFGSYLLTAARLAELRKGENPPENLVEDVVAASKDLVLQTSKETFSDSLAEFTEALQDDRSLAKYMEGIGASFVPRAISQFDQRIRAQSKEPGFVEGFKNKIPGQGAAKLGLFGKERTSQAPGVSLALGRSGKVGNDPIAQEMVRVGSFHLPPNGLSKDFKSQLARRKINYSDSEDRTLQVARGRVQEMAVKNMVASPRYQNLPQTPAGDAVRKTLIDRAFEEASKQVDQRAKALKLAKIPLTERGILGR